MPNRLGIQKSLDIVMKLDVETLRAIEEVILYYQNKSSTVIFTAFRLAKNRGIDDSDDE